MRTVGIIDDHALERLTATMRDIESELASMKAGHEPLVNVHLIGTCSPKELPA